MALNINGTTGISGVDGSASAASIAGTDANTGLSFASDTVNINTGGVTRATLDSNGRLGVATTSPNTFAIATFNDSNGISLTGSTQTRLVMTHQNGGTDEKNFDIQLDSGNLKFRKIGDNNTTVTERMRIDSSGRILAGTTSAYAQNALVLAKSSAANISVYNSWNIGDSGSRFHFEFRDSSDGGSRGNITTNGGSTSYNTSSDYRLKENVTAISDGITRLKTLKPSRFNFKADKDTTVDGFLAHEVTAVPEAITGTKDEVDSDNNPIYQGIDQGKLVPLLTAALQEAVAKIEVLETKVAALEAA